MDNSEKRRAMRMAIYHLTMGALLFVVATLVLVTKNFGNTSLDTNFSYLLGGLFLVYGIFRLYRGIVEVRNWRQA